MNRNLVNQLYICAGKEIFSEKGASPKMLSSLRENLIAPIKWGSERTTIAGTFRNDSNSSIFAVPPGAEDPQCVSENHQKRTCERYSIIGKPLGGELFSFFTDDLIDKPSQGIKYQWKVFGGRVVSGQGTTSIKVRASRNNKDKLVARLDVLGTSALCQSIGEYSFPKPR